ncbi:MAG: hypothetical protein KF819_17815 [Labilithrix sp.]|nr:hypothetical protein [Labilithrix sp.]
MKEGPPAGRRITFTDMQGPGGQHPFRSASPPPVTIEPPDPYLEALTRQVRRRQATMRVLTVIFAAVPILLCVYAFGHTTFDRLRYRITHPEREISAAKKKAIAAQLEGAKTRANEEGDALAAGVRAAYTTDKLVARSDLGACPVRLGAPSTSRPDAYGTYGAYPAPWQRASAPFPFVRVLAPDARRVGSKASPVDPDKATIDPSTFTALGAIAPLSTMKGPSTESILFQASSIEGRAKQKYRERDPSEQIFAESQRLATRKLDYDVVLVIDRYREPYGTPRVGFTSGYVGGTAFVWDFASRKVACVARVHAFNSETVRYEYRAPKYAPYAGGSLELAGALRRDLETETVRAVARSMKHRAGPALGDEPQVDVADLLEDLGLFGDADKKPATADED